MRQDQLLGWEGSLGHVAVLLRGDVSSRLLSRVSLHGALVQGAALREGPGTGGSVMIVLDAILAALQSSHMQRTVAFRRFAAPVNL